MTHEVEVSRSVPPLDEEPGSSRVIQWVREVLDELAGGASQVSVHITGREEMARLNLEYRGRPQPTNVLSFSSGLTLADEVTFLGDVVICSEIVREESDRFGKPFPERYAHLLIHGVLHLLGHEHEAAPQRERMEAAETRLMRRLGFGSPYHE